MYPKLIRLAILSQYQLVNMNIYRKGHKHNLFAYNLEKKGEHLMLLSNNIKCRALVSMPCSLIFWLVHFSFYFKLITWECKCTMHFRRLGNSTTKLKLYQQKKKKTKPLRHLNSTTHQITKQQRTSRWLRSTLSFDEWPLYFPLFSPVMVLSSIRSNENAKTGQAKNQRNY